MPINTKLYIPELERRIAYLRAQIAERDSQIAEMQKHPLFVWNSHEACRDANCPLLEAKP